MAVEIHPTAIVHPSAVLGVDVRVGPYCVVAGQLGDGCSLASHVVVEAGCSLGPGCSVSPFACLGGAPQDRKFRGGPSRLIIGAETVIREHVTAHGGTAQGGGETRIGAQNLLMVGVHVAHDCRLGDRITLANQVALGGHVEIADDVLIGGLTGLHQFVRVGQGAAIGGASAVRRDVPPFCLVRGAEGRIRGLNLVGLRRQGIERAALAELRGLLRCLADQGGGPLQARLPADGTSWRARVLLEFLKAPSRRGLALVDRA